MVSTCFVNPIATRTNLFSPWSKMDNAFIIVLIMLAMARFSMRKRIRFSIVSCLHWLSESNWWQTSFPSALDEWLEYYQGDGARHLRCILTTPLRGHPLPAFAQRRGSTTVLHQAATQGQRDVIALLLEDPSCPDIHAKNEEGLFMLIDSWQMTWLHSFSHQGNTPLHEACFFGRDDAVKALLKAGASWKYVNKLGWTSLHVRAVRFPRMPTSLSHHLASCSR